MVIPGWIASYGNNYIDSLIQDFVWSDALAAPIIEEGVKFLCVFLIFYLLDLKKMSEIFILGMGVGFGFQLMEDFSYIFIAASVSSQEIFIQTINRISGALGSHWAYTGIFSFGIFLFFFNNKKEVWTQSVKYIISPVLLHFFWNSPINETYYMTSYILTTITLTMIVMIMKKVKNHDNENMNS